MNTLHKILLSGFLVSLSLLGTERRCPAQLSPDIHEDKRVTFRLNAPQAKEVFLLGDWRKPNESLPMIKSDDGVWTISAGPFLPGNHIYSYEVDGIQVPDPQNALVKIRATGVGSFVHVPGNAVWEPANVPHGKVELNYHQSKVLGDTRWFNVYTPPSYDQDLEKDYPVLYLLHGSNDTPHGWVMIGSVNFAMDNLLRRRAVEEMIIVMPNGHAVPHGSPREIQRTNGEKFEDYLLNDVIPTVERKYRVRKSRQDRAIVGLSMGGGQAINIGLKHLDLFSTIGSFSGAVPNAEQGEVATILKGAEKVNESLDLFWLGCGADDFLLERNKSFAKLLEQHEIEHEFRVTEGVHNYEVWRKYFVSIAPALFRESVSTAGKTGNADNVTYLGGSDPNGNPVRLARQSGHVSNYDEAKVKAYSLPDPLLMNDGTKVNSAEQWEKRRAEILDFYQTEIYGKVPENAPAITWKITETKENAYGDLATSKMIEGTIQSGDKQSSQKIHVVLYVPKEAKEPVPVLLNLSFFNATTERQPNRRGSFDSISEVLSHGWAYAQVGYSEIQPDRPNQFQSGLIGMTLEEGEVKPKSDQWGTISAWAWGASRVIDYLESDNSIDRNRISITGTSRLGKTVLWAAANDERIQCVFSIVPGSMGASLIRRDWGETLDDMAQNFHWQFAGNLQHWVGRWDELPVDQHMLIALIAPRPIYINGGLSDQWSDPKGEFLSMVGAGPVFRLLGASDLGTTDDLELDRPIITTHMGFHYHSQGHGAVPSDWTNFLEFADRSFESR